MPAEVDRGLRAAVQHNCHLSDAHHAGDYTMCVYLLKMRELFRWEAGYAFTDTLPKDELGPWLSRREQLWEDIEGGELRPVPVAGENFDPFDVDAINQHLEGVGLVYGGGLGVRGRPLFFLAERLRAEDHGGHRIVVSATEYARDLTAPPAMSQGRTIYIRRESLRRMLWEKVEQWQWNRPDNAMARAMEFYDFSSDPMAALESMLEHETETVICHEVGEIMAGKELGEAWHELLIRLPRSKAELMARAARDNLADCLSTLPMLLARDDPAGLHFYFGNFEGMRKVLYPSLMDAYDQWCDSGKIDTLSACVERGAVHWNEVLLGLVALREDDALASRAEDFLDRQIL